MRRYSVWVSAFMSDLLLFLCIRSRSVLLTDICGSRVIGHMMMIMDIIGCRVIGLNRLRSASFGRPAIGVMSEASMPGMPVIGGRISASMAVSIMDAGITVRALPAAIG